MAPEGFQFDARQYDAKVAELLSSYDEQDFFTSYYEVYESFDDMRLQENLLRGIYAYGIEEPSAIQQSGMVPFCNELVRLDVIQQALEQLDYGRGKKLHGLKVLPTAGIRPGHLVMKTKKENRKKFHVGISISSEKLSPRPSFRGVYILEELCLINI